MGALEDVQTVVATLQNVETELSLPATESTGDTVLAALVSALEAAGYTVTAPVAVEGEAASTETPPES